MPSTNYMQVCDRIREDVLRGVLPFGGRLKIERLAARYATSPMPVREALRHLEGEGLVVMLPNRGARVRAIDVEFVSNMFDLRIALEALLTRRAAERIGPAALAELEALERRLEAEGAAGDTGAVLAANQAFHRLINEVAGNPEATAVVDRHWRLIAALWRRYGYDAPRLSGVISDHRQILLAFAARDADTAAALAAAHAAKAKQDLIRRMRADPIATALTAAAE